MRSGSSSSVVPVPGSPSRDPLTVAVEHALDLAEVDAVRTALSCVLADRVLAPGSEIVLEMSGCDFVDGSGYRLLCEVADEVQRRESVLHLTGVRAEVARVLRLLDRVLGGGVQQHVRDMRPTVPTSAWSEPTACAVAGRVPRRR